MMEGAVMIAGVLREIHKVVNGEVLSPTVTAILVGLPILAFHLALFLKPEPVLAFLAKMPRSTRVGMVLAGICVPWFALLLYFNIPFPSMAPYKNIICLVAVLMYVPIVLSMPELLSVRALGCLGLLAGVPILNGIRYSESPLRLIIVTWVYAMVVLAAILVLHPYRFRRWVNRWFVPGGSRKFWALAGIVTGAGFVVIGLLL